MDIMNIRDTHSRFGDPGDERARKLVVLDTFRDKILLSLSVCRSTRIFFPRHFRFF